MARFIAGREYPLRWASLDATLQMFHIVRSFCLRVSGAVAPSAPALPVSPALSRLKYITPDNSEQLNLIGESFDVAEVNIQQCGIVMT